MKLHVHFETGEMKVNEVVSGNNAEELVAAMQKRVAQEAGFLIGAIVRRMSPLQFAQEVTKRYNSAMNGTAPIPTTCEQFIDTGVENGFATRIED